MDEKGIPTSISIIIATAVFGAFFVAGMICLALLAT